MTEKRLNNCLLLHIHKDVTDSIDLVEIAEEFIVVGLFISTKTILVHFQCNYCCELMNILSYAMC